MLAGPRAGCPPRFCPCRVRVALTMSRRRSTAHTDPPKPETRVSEESEEDLIDEAAFSAVVFAADTFAKASEDMDVV